MAAETGCSIIVVSYNNYDNCTAPCLQSLLLDPTEIEIIVVDNNSDTYTKSRLAELAHHEHRIRVQFNTSNRGYAGGNNDGVAMAESDIVILLNNDTLVPVGAIQQFTDLFSEHPDWDMIGPVTNSCGNEQQVQTEGTDIPSILLQGTSWCDHSHDFSFATDLLGFFCVAIRKHVYEELSGLDEDFGLGFYEDTDFCHRAQQEKKKIMITEDIFIYHQGSATFAKLPAKTRQLMAKNRKLFKKKHGCPPAAMHVREKNLQVLKTYRKQIESQGMDNGICYRAMNRLLIARDLQPNNPVKKFFYWNRLKPLQQFFNHSG